MKQEITLLIMAAGLGSRFGSLKQIEPIGPNGEILIEYSISDAIKAGFTKMIFVIKKEHLDAFKEKIGNKISRNIKVEYAFQNTSELEKKLNIKREKPFGTVHAVLSAKQEISEPFGIINADDYYGYTSYQKLYNFLTSKEIKDSNCIISYNLKNTMSKNGDVKRGICKIKEENVTYINDYNVEIKKDLIIARSFDGKEIMELDDNTRCCMNMFGLNNNILTNLTDEFNEFLEASNIEKDECILPVVISNLIQKNKIKVKNINSEEKWHGITYKEDKIELQEAIKQYIKLGNY